MIEAFSRSQIFKQSLFADNQVALEQQTIYKMMDHDNPDEIAYMLPLLDHLEPFNPQPLYADQFCVLAFGAPNLTSYHNNFANMVIDFLSAFNIEDIYLLTTCNTNWANYVFEDAKKQQRLFSYLKEQKTGMGFRFKVKDLREMLPLFYHAHPDYPHINLLPAAGDVAINLLLCKDGNLHTLFAASLQEKLDKAAADAGLIKGSFELCHTIKNNL